MIELSATRWINHLEAAQERGESRASLHDHSLAVAGSGACMQVNQPSSNSGSLVRDHGRAAGRPVVQKRMYNIKVGSVYVQHVENLKSLDGVSSHRL